MYSPLRRPPALSHCRRAFLPKSYATEAAATPTESSSSTTRHPLDFKSYLQRNQLLYIRCRDDSADSMPEFLGILRGVEREFGRVREYQFHRDPYDTRRLQKWFRVRLDDPNAWERVPEGGKTLHVDVPDVRDSRPGGISISDVQALLEPQDRVEDNGSVGGGDVRQNPFSNVKPQEKQHKQVPRTRQVEIRVERSVVKDLEQAKWVVSKERRRKIGEALVGWGGFYQPASQDLTEEEATKLARMSQLRARYTVPPAPEIIESPVEAEAEVEEVVQVEAQEPQSELRQETTAEAVEGEEVEVPTTEPTLPTTNAVETEEVSSALEHPVSTSTLPIPPAQFTNPHGSGKARRRQKLLEAARKNAQTPLPETVRFEKPQEPKAPEEAKTEREEKRQAMRERVWKLMGGFLR